MTVFNPLMITYQVHDKCGTSDWWGDTDIQGWTYGLVLTLDDIDSGHQKDNSVHLYSL